VIISTSDGSPLPERTLEQEKGNGWAKGVHPDDFEHCLAVCLESFKRREPFEMEYRLCRHDGVYRWIFDRDTPFYGAKGDFAGYIGSCNDSTDLVAARQALLLAKELELEALRKLLPICSLCKKIRDDSGYWKDVEA